jgi:AraC-like DNA-binding protein
MSYHAKQSWLRFIFAVFLITLLIYVLLFYQLRKYKRLPKKSDIEGTQILIVSDKEFRKDLSVEQSILQKATNFIIQNRSEACSSEKVASYLGVSLRKFQSITRKELKCTPTNFIYLVKLKQAAQYLKNKEGNVSETAYEYGFSDPSYFSKMFKNHFGVSPSMYIDNEEL